MQDLIYVDAAWLGIAFIMGFIARRLNLPALIGFLIAGLILNLLNLHKGHINDMIGTLADFGVMLLLFTIGLKIKIKNIISRHILVTATVNTILTILVIGSLLFLLSFTGLQMFSDLDLKACLMIGFALSFSSTVFVVKVLEERGEISSFHGKIAIGILVIQDIFAVLFMTFVSDLRPSWFVLLVPFYLYGVKFLLSYILDHLDHGELLTIFGFFATFITGALAFYLVGLKPDLGALIIGMLLVKHPKADELYDRMMTYKDFFLVAFFISIGLTGEITLTTLVLTLLLIPFIFFKAAVFIMSLSRFKIQARTAFLSAMSLSNYSEFALIIGVLGVKAGWLPNEWIMAFALLMSFSFLIGSPLNNYAHELFDKYKYLIMKLNTGRQYVDEEPRSIGDAEYLILGFGSIGEPTYHYFADEMNARVMAIEYDHEKVNSFKGKGININWGDPSNSIFWESIDLSGVKLVVLTMTDINSSINILKEIQKIKVRNFKVGAYAMYQDEGALLREYDVDFVYEYKVKRGLDFAKQVYERYNQPNIEKNPDLSLPAITL